MNRSILENQMALPEVEAKEGTMRAISLGSLAILEQLGNPLVYTVMGIGDVQFTDSAVNLLELLYVHTVSDEEYYDIVRNIHQPEIIKQQAIMWGSNMGVNNITEKVRELMITSELIKSSMVESAKKKANKSKN